MFATRLDLLYGWLFATPGSAHGFAASDLKAAEKQLRYPLPEFLREFYRRAGSNRDVMGAHLRFYAPHLLRIDRGHLIFCEEHQKAGHYAVPVGELSRLDPAVVQGGPDATGWRPECRQLSIFLLKSLCWQAVNSLPSAATAPFSADSLPALASLVESVAPAEGDDGAFLAFADEGLVVCAFQRSAILYVAAYTDARLEQFEADLGVELNYL
jgi:hypothetical protein